jgi:hypothetical protein
MFAQSIDIDGGVAFSFTHRLLTSYNCREEEAVISVPFLKQGV